MRSTLSEATQDETGRSPGMIHVRYWAAARAAAGCESDDVAVDGERTLAEVLAEVARRHPHGRLAEVMAACSVLLGDRPVGTADHSDVLVAPGTSVELLPPFAGG